MSAAKPFRRLLVEWNGSRGASATLRASAAIVGNEEGHVVALAVLPPAWHTETAQERSANEIAARERVRTPFERLQAGLAALCSARIDLQFAEDPNIPQALCRYATEHGFDLLVLGRQGEGGAAARKLGHVADSAVRNGGIQLLLATR